MYSTLVISEDSVKYAMQKVQTFINLNKPQDYDYKLDALEMFCQSLGVNEDIMEQIFDGVAEQFGIEGTNHIFVGTLVGLAIAEHGIENYPQNS